ncbi:MAG: hypothetical protein LBD67_02055 [Candidatus Accumulibacter sp.]|nr:hypothetical protein [Accumulibacter sp.]
MVFQSLPFDKLRANGLKNMTSTGSGRSRANGLKNMTSTGSGRSRTDGLENEHLTNRTGKRMGKTFSSQASFGLKMA